MEKGLTIKEAAEFLGLSRARVYQLKGDKIELNEDNTLNMESLKRYKASPKKKTGRPTGTFKKREERKWTK